MEEMESIEYKSGVICISLGDDNKAIDSSNKDYKIDFDVDYCDEDTRP